MTEDDIKDVLFKKFVTLNETSGKPLIKNGNVAYPNVKFTVPSNHQWFELSFKSNPPNPAAMCENAQNRWTGFLQIDICTPLDVGVTEADDKYNEISKLFEEGSSADFVDIVRTYSPTEDAEEYCYRKVVRVEWTADIDR